jgi:hypothetical protein
VSGRGVAKIAKYGRDFSGECEIVTPKGGNNVGAVVPHGRSAAVFRRPARVWMS